jgi:outer membrane receptor protein involved in Fe transport
VFKTNENTRTLRSALLLGAASAAIGMTAPAAAQQGGGNVETVVVTGSRIPQTGIYSASPVTAIGQQELKFEGTTDVTTLLNNLPESFADQSSAAANGASGTANADLRGLGSVRTLVLVNGTRLMPGDPKDPAPDLNDIPAALVDHVEVLTGGASAVYGSDALAGVINFIMRKDFEGVEVDGTYDITQNDNTTGRWRSYTQTQINGNAYGFAQSKENIFNGGTDDGTLIMGANTANDKGNVTAYLGYRNTQPVLEGSRDFSECTLATTGVGLVCAGSSNYNRFFSIDNYFYGNGKGGKTYDWFEEGTGKAGSGHYVPYTGAPNQAYNYGSLNYLQRPDQRYTGGFYAHYEENKELDIYSSFMFADDHTVAQIAPSGLFLGSGTVSGYAQEINCANPLMTAQENQLVCGDNKSTTATAIGPNGKPYTYYTGNNNVIPGQAKFEIGRRDIEGGNRQDDLRHTSYRMNIGARGDFGSGWTYDVYAQYGLTLLTENYLNEFSKSRVQDALEVNPNGTCISGNAGCVPLNIFDGLGAITPGQLAYVGADGFQEGFTQEQIVSGNVTGDLGEWGGQSPWAKNPVAVSIGSEYRDEQLKLATDSEFTSNDLYGQGSPTLSIPQSGFDVSEIFTELKVPLIQGVPWFEDLSLNGSYRYSSYNTAGATNTYKYGAEWQPVDDFRFRGSVDRAVRAPNVLELFSPDTVGLFSGQDPCSQAGNPNAATIANCKKEGVSNAGSSLLDCPATQCNVETGGNALLRPETSNTRTAGFVFTPTFVDGFTATVDYFDIKINKTISVVNPSLTLNECYGASATGATQSFFCPLVHRNAVSGIIYGNGFVGATNQNTGYLATRGIDFELNYQNDMSSFGLPDVGSLGFNEVGTWIDTLTTEAIPGFPAYNCAGLYGLTCGASTTAGGPIPKWRNKLRVTWSTPWDVDVSLQWRFLGATALDADTTNPLVGGSSTATVCPNGKTVYGIGDCVDANIAAYNYFDLSGDWTIRQGVDLRGGVNNIFDLEPPILGTSVLPLPAGNGNTFPSTYDALGRTIFVSATIKY